MTKPILEAVTASAGHWPVPSFRLYEHVKDAKDGDSRDRRAVAVRSGHAEPRRPGHCSRASERIEAGPALAADYCSLTAFSNDLRNQLAITIGFSQALMDGALTSDDDRSRAAFAINEAGWGSVRLLERVLSDRRESECGTVSMGTRDVGTCVSTGRSTHNADENDED